MTSVPDWLADIRVLSFDLDDTLWDCAPAIRLAEAALLEWLGREAPRVLERHDEVSLAAHRARTVAAHPELGGDVTAMRRRIIASLLDEHGYADVALVDAAFDVFLHARSDVILYDGVHETLDALGRRYRLAAITNGNADLERIGLARHFEPILAASLERAPKPAPDMFRLCMDHAGIAPHRLLHIGDNALTDVGGAQAAGARALWFNARAERWPEGVRPPDLEARSVRALAPLLGVGVTDDRAAPPPRHHQENA